MVTPEIGDVVLVRFPFSDLSADKLRPALVIADSGRGDWICAQITSNPYADNRAEQLTDIDFESGSLQRVSFVRPGKLFTANSALFLRVVGHLNLAAIERCRTAVVQLFR